MPLLPVPNGVQALLDQILLGVRDGHRDEGGRAPAEVLVGLPVGFLLANQDDVHGLGSRSDHAPNRWDDAIKAIGKDESSGRVVSGGHDFDFHLGR